jgi:GDP-mannose 6-dehydrogenase
VRLRIYDPVVNPERLVGANLRYVESRLPHLREMLCSTPEEALAGAEVAIVGTSDAAALGALLAAPPARVLDVQGRLGEEIEALPGYEGLAW